jgi:phosphoglycerate dehydrogenase-like enzyme
MKTVLHYRAGPGFQTQIAANATADIDVVIVDEGDATAFAREMSDADALLHVLKPVTADVIAAAPGLKLIQKAGVGVNTIDLGAAQEHGVAVANMPGTNSQAVAEMTLALMLATLRRVPLLDSAMRDGRASQTGGHDPVWRRAADACHRTDPRARREAPAPRRTL